MSAQRRSARSAPESSAVEWHPITAKAGEDPASADQCSPDSALDEALQLLRAARVTQLAQRLRLDLADALASYFEVLSDFFERVVALLADAEAHAQNLFLARRERLQHLPRLL